MRRTGEYIEEHQDFILFNKGDIEGQGGVGFIVKKYLKEHIIEFIGINDRTAILNVILPSFKKTWTIIQVYAPTEQADELKHQKNQGRHQKGRKVKRLQTQVKHITRTCGTRKAPKELRESNQWIPKLKNNQKNVTGRKNINRIATKFYRNLYSNQDTTTYVSRETLNYNLLLVNPEPDILPSETRKAILSQKLDKAPGPDKITNELLRGTVKELVPILTKIFNGILRSGQVPEQWETSHIILIHKKGQKDDIGNYRPISLMSNIYKIFFKIILNRISNTLDENQPKEQAGFRKNFSTIDHIHTVKQIMEKYNEYNKPLYMAFVDYSKAFDSISHTAIRESLRNQGIPTVYINTIKNIYSNSKARVQLETLGETFQVKRGVRQGDPMSPKLFSAVLENTFRKLIWDQHGLNIDGQKLNHLRFADDIVLFAEQPGILENMIQDLNKESEKVSLPMNINKTKLLTNSNKYDKN
ncbi:LINE-1 retrotransposable element ORF2 protein [Eumeta japonica]|uniref:LINE-1 retrotransposable element ORF2 protein n=1 Tax=Eumeta variegata TaxID=151549 RepID=A0A4C1TGF4_EUMVA|nr:LINE-1 retrotransposable element ORF2 protein [Eumeta japonica]